MLPGSQSSKIKHATLDISGDPGFRLRSTIPPGGWILAITVVCAALTVLVLMLVADGALQRQHQVVEANDCVNTVRGLVDLRTHVYAADDRRAANATACIQAVPSFDARADELLATIVSTLETVRVVHGKDARAEKDAVFKLEEAVDEFYRWHMQNKARYGL